MVHTPKAQQGIDAESTRRGIDRRRVLQGVAAGAVTVAGLSVTSGSAVAQGEDQLDGNCPASPYCISASVSWNSPIARSETVASTSSLSIRRRCFPTALAEQSRSAAMPS